MIDFSETDNVGRYLEGSKIIRMYTCDYNLHLEGGQVIVFEKYDKAGIYIIGYTEIGDWVYHFEHNTEFHIDKFYLDEINIIRKDNGFSYVLESE